MIVALLFRGVVYRVAYNVNLNCFSCVTNRAVHCKFVDMLLNVDTHFPVSLLWTSLFNIVIFVLITGLLFVYYTVNKLARRCCVFLRCDCEAYARFSYRLLSVRLSNACIVTKRHNCLYIYEHHTIEQCF